MVFSSFLTAKIAQGLKPLFFLGGMTGTILTGNYYKNNIRDYSFEFDPNPQNLKISEMLAEYFDSFNPNMFLSTSGLSQLIYMAKVYKPCTNKEFRREYIILQDGGQISQDFSISNKQSNKKIVMIIHGLTGGSDASYIQHMIKSCEAKNINSVVFQSRGINQTKLLNPKLQHPQELEDYERALDQIKKDYPSNEVYLIGFSMGGNYLLRFLPKLPSGKGVKAAVAVSPPFDLNHTVDNITDTIYEKFFLDMYK